MDNPAEVYEELFVPALLEQFSKIVADLAEIQSGQAVLDVACGTGVVAIEAANRAGSASKVTGLDPNPQMLEVARRKDNRISWVEGKAENLEFMDGSYDVVVSQFGLMFFDDKPAGLKEMMRVLKPGGKLTVAVWDSIENATGYAALMEPLKRLFGDTVTQAYSAPYVLGDEEKLRSLCNKAGIKDAEIIKKSLPVSFESVEALVYAERMCVWSLGGLLNKSQFEALLEEAKQVLRPYTKPDGSVTFPMSALIIKATK